jgi:hypothetical protein
VEIAGRATYPLVTAELERLFRQSKEKDAEPVKLGKRKQDHSSNQVKNNPKAKKNKQEEESEWEYCDICKRDHLGDHDDVKASRGTKTFPQCPGPKFPTTQQAVNSGGSKRQESVAIVTETYRASLVDLCSVITDKDGTINRTNLVCIDHYDRSWIEGYTGLSRSMRPQWYVAPLWWCKSNHIRFKSHRSSWCWSQYHR